MAFILLNREFYNFSYFSFNLNLVYRSKSNN